MVKAIYLIQIIFLLADIYMVWQARKAINRLGIGLILLFSLLIVRRLDDMGRNAEELGILVLSSVIVVIVTYEVFSVYQHRELYTQYLENRQKRIETFDAMSQADVSERRR